MMNKTKKTAGWLVMAAALTTGMTACSNDDNIIDEPILTGPKTYTLTVAATKGDDATTRALSLDGTTLNATWAAGETVRVYSITGEGYSEAESSDPVATLTAQGSGVTTTLAGTFIGSYTPTVNAKLRLKFCSPTYTGQKGTQAYIAANCDYAIADATITNVNGSNVTTTVATFANQQAIVKFSLKDKATDAAVAAKWLTVKYASSTYDVTLDDPASDIFVAIPQKSNKAVTLTAITADGKVYTYEKTGVTFTNGKYYAITVKMTRQPALGDLYYSDGTYSATLEAGKTPIGVIAYLGTDAFSENGVTLRDGSTTLQSHGLVLCLKNAANTKWRKGTEEGASSVFDISADAEVDDTGDLKRTTNVSGYTNTKYLIDKRNNTNDVATYYPAAYQAWNYTGLTAPDGTTGWFLPSAQQWVKMLEGLGELSESVIAWQTKFDTGLSAIAKFEAAMGKAGAKGTAFDGMDTKQYWSSSECMVGAAVHILINSSYNNSIVITWQVKNYLDDVRPVLAF